MEHLRVNSHDMAYVALGRGPTLVCVHGSLGDFRVWHAQFGPLSRDRRLISVSLRHFFPDRSVGDGSTYKMAQHVDDTIAFIVALGVGKVDLMGHSRGGHIAFRVAQLRPDLVNKLILAEPGGDLDPSLRPPGNAAPPMRNNVLLAAERVAAGDVDGGLERFIDTLEGAGTWKAMAPGIQQELRDNAHTLVGQTDEQRQPYAKADAEAIEAPTLFICGGNTPGNLPVVLRALAAHVKNARIVTIPGTTHFMFEQDPIAYNRAVLEFLGGS